MEMSGGERRGVKVKGNSGNESGRGEKERKGKRIEEVVRGAWEI